MARVSPQEVKDILGDNYDCINNPTLLPYIKGANLITNRANTCATDKGYTLSTSELKEIERWLAAHLYTINDPIYKSKSTLSSSASFMDRTYLDGAKMIDPSGCVTAIVEGNRADLDWLGKTESEQLDYVDRQ